MAYEAKWPTRSSQRQFKNSQWLRNSQMKFTQLTVSIKLGTTFRPIYFANKKKCIFFPKKKRKKERKTCIYKIQGNLKELHFLSLASMTRCLQIKFYLKNVNNFRTRFTFTLSLSSFKHLTLFPKPRSSYKWFLVRIAVSGNPLRNIQLQQTTNRTKLVNQKWLFSPIMTLGFELHISCDIVTMPTSHDVFIGPWRPNTLWWAIQLEAPYSLLGWPIQFLRFWKSVTTEVTSIMFF